MTDSTAPGFGGKGGGTEPPDGTDFQTWCDAESDRGIALDPRTSTVLILAIVAVLFTVFSLTSHQLDYSLRFADPEVLQEVDHNPNPGGIKRRAAIISLGAISGLLLFRQRRFSLWHANTTTWSILAYISFAAVSVLWADDSVVVVRRVFSFLILSFSAFAISLTVPLRKLPLVLLLSTLMFLSVGIFSELYNGTFLHSMTDAYRFSGTCHPEGQAMNCAMLILASIVVTKTTQGFWLFASHFTTLIGLVFLLLTRSRGPFVATIISIIAFRYYTSERKSNISIIYTVILVFSLFFLAYGEPALDILETGILMGRSENQNYDLNGRIPLWSECLEFVAERPLFGYGFQGFWTQNRIEDISNSQGWFLNHSHSIYLETTLNLGFLGLGLFMMMLISGWMCARRSYIFNQDIGMIFALMVITLTLIDGIMTSSVGGVNYLVYFLFIILFSIARESVSLGVNE